MDENGYVVRIVEKGKNIYTKIFKHYSYDMINYAIVRDVLLRKHMEEMRINDIADARVVEATRTDLKKLYSDIEISVNNKEFAYILDGHEKFNNTDLPKDVQDFLEEIYNDEDLKDAFSIVILKSMMRHGLRILRRMIRGLKILWDRENPVIRILNRLHVTA